MHLSPRALVIIAIFAIMFIAFLIYALVKV
jgi:hypothetical protein